MPNPVGNGAIFLRNPGRRIMLPALERGVQRKESHLRHWTVKTALRPAFAGESLPQPPRSSALFHPAYSDAPVGSSNGPW